MFKKNKEIVAMLLAGGQGSRLHVLTKNTAKPAIPFGGKYRIIDFTLSNCINSGIDTVGVLTQYQPLELNAYIGNGIPWDLNRLNGGVSILPPYVKADSGEWYKGTANAVYQNIRFIEKYNPLGSSSDWRDHFSPVCRQTLAEISTLPRSFHWARPRERPFASEWYAPRPSILS